MSQLGLVKTNQSYQGALLALEPLKNDLEKKLANLEKLVIKINMVNTKIELSTTPFETVKAFIDLVKPFYQGKIIISEESSSGGTENGFERYGFKKLADQDPQIEIFNSGKDKAKKIKIKYPSGEIKLPLAKIYLDSPFTASITRAKTHDTVVVTLAVKNLLVGAIQKGFGFFGHRGKIHQGKEINWILAKIAEFTYPNLAIIDAVIGMEGNGPDYGTPTKAGWMVASLDPLAADSLATHLMGFDINDVGYLNLLREKNFGLLYPKDKIKIVGPNPQKLITPFVPHDSFDHQRQWR